MAELDNFHALLLLPGRHIQQGMRMRNPPVINRRMNPLTVLSDTELTVFPCQYSWLTLSVAICLSLSMSRSKICNGNYLVCYCNVYIAIIIIRVFYYVDLVFFYLFSLFLFKICIPYFFSHFFFFVNQLFTMILFKEVPGLSCAHLSGFLSVRLSFLWPIL